MARNLPKKESRKISQVTPEQKRERNIARNHRRCEDKKAQKQGRQIAANTVVFAQPSFEVAETSVPTTVPSAIVPEKKKGYFAKLFHSLFA